MKSLERREFIASYKDKMTVAAEMASPEKVGTRLRIFSDAKNNLHAMKITQLDWSELLEKTPQSIGYIVRGDQRLSLAEAAKISAVLDISIDELATGTSKSQKVINNNDEVKKLSADLNRTEQMLQLALKQIQLLESK